MVKVKESLSYENYKFQTLIPNEFDNPGDIIMGKLNQLISESKRIIPIVRKSPESVLAVDVKIIKENHDNFTQLPKT